MIKVIILLLLFVTSVYADIQCDGVDDALTQSLTMDQFFSNTAFTTMGWVKTTSDDGTGIACYEGFFILGDATGVEAAILSRTGTTGEDACSYIWEEGNGTHEVYSTGTFTPGWHHVGLRLGSGTLTLFMDGVSVDTEASGTFIALITTELLRMCSNVSGYAPSTDRFSYWKTYNVAVSDAEILRHAKSKLMMYDSTQPTAYWRLDDCASGASGDGVSFKDRGNSDRNLTGDNGANNTGLTCVGNDFLSYPMGIQ